MPKPRHTKTTLLRMAACEALGLHYWSGHPLSGCVWAVDDSQTPHVVKIDAKKGTAAKVQTHDKVVGYDQVRDKDIALGNPGAWVKVPRTELKIYSSSDSFAFDVTDETAYLFAA